MHATGFRYGIPLRSVQSLRNLCAVLRKEDSHRRFKLSRQASMSYSISRQLLTPSMDDYLKGIYSGLRARAPAVSLHGDDIEIINTPSGFYEALKNGILEAKQQISIASLYLGTGGLERGLVDALEQALEKNPDIRVQIVLDYSRGQRNRPKSSVDVIGTLAAKFPGRFTLSLFRAPILRGLLKWTPSPWNETLGVFHLKAYVFDDQLIMSGANLSEDYFTNRQDRCMSLKRSKGLASYYHDLVHTVAQHSHEVIAVEGRGFELVSHEKPLKTLKEDLDRFCEPEFLPLDEEPDKADTWAFLTVQMNPVGVLHDHSVTRFLLETLKRGWTTTIASGYLNFPEYFIQELIECKALVKVITASPKANGFYVAKGVAGAVPMAYTLIEKRFFNMCRSRKSDLQLYEYERDGWTFHGKGIWATPPDAEDPFLTSIGSPNFGRRSHEKDLESQIFIITENANLRRALHAEQQHLEQYCKKVTAETFQEDERRLSGLGWKQGLWIAPVAGIIASFF